MKTINLVLFFFIISLSAFTKEYHVDCSNSLQGNGSLENPFKTIAQAADVMVGGDICYIHKGTYRETIDPKNSGSALHPITFTSYKDDVVIVSATEEVFGWEKHTGNIYKKSKVNSITIGSSMFPK
jgi:hypothetical protein